MSYIFIQIRIVDIVMVTVLILRSSQLQEVITVPSLRNRRFVEIGTGNT